MKVDYHFPLLEIAHLLRTTVCVVVSVAWLSACTPAGFLVYAQVNPRSGLIPEWPTDLHGVYLGQQVPGNTPEVFAEGIISLGNHEHHLTLAPQGREFLYVIADKYRVRHTLIWVVQRDGVWREPEVAHFSGAYNDFAPSFFPDGSALLFCSNRPLPGAEGPADDSNIWRVDRTDTGWGEPRPLPAPVNDGTSEYNPSITEHGLLVFQDHDESGPDIYETRMVDAVWQPPRRIGGGVSTEHADITPFVSPDGSQLFFASDRPGGFGYADLYLSRLLPDGSWSNPQNLGEEINTAASDAVPTLAPGGDLLFFTSFLGYGAADLGGHSYERLARLLRSARNGDGTLFWVALTEPDESLQ